MVCFNSLLHKSLKQFGNWEAFGETVISLFVVTGFLWHGSGLLKVFVQMQSNSSPWDQWFCMFLNLKCVCEVYVCYLLSMHKSIHVSTGPVSLVISLWETTNMFGNKKLSVGHRGLNSQVITVFRAPILTSASYMLASSSSPAPTVFSVCKPEKHTAVIAKQSSIY